MILYEDTLKLIPHSISCTEGLGYFIPHEDKWWWANVRVGDNSFLSTEQKQRFVACSLYKKSESLNLESFLQDSSKTTYIILYPESLLLQVTSLGVLKRRLTLRPTRCSWHKQVMGFSGRDLCFVCLVILACLVCKLPGVRALTQRI